MKAVVIFGTATSLRDWPPKHLPETAEFWGANTMYLSFPTLWQTADRWFEMHRLAYLDTLKNGHIKELAKAEKGVIYMLERTPRVPTSRTYPLKEVNKFLASKGARTNYFCSTFSYQVALALMEGFTDIHLYGVDFYCEGERAFERAGLEYLLGFAQGIGVKVHLAPSSPLLQTPYLYGYDEPKLKLEDVRPLMEFLEQLEVSVGAYGDLKTASGGDTAENLISVAESYATAKTLRSVRTWLRHYGRGGSLLKPDMSVNE